MIDRLDISLDISLHYIQSIRLTQALMEAGARVHLSRNEQIKFTALKRIFHTSPTYTLERAPLLCDVVIDHASPVTSVGRIQRSLIFPNRMFDYLRERWRVTRRHHITFAGLLTVPRIDRINAWLTSYDSTQRPIPAPGLRRRIIEKVKARLDCSSTYTIQRADVMLWSSNKGRRFPVKAWDSDYFDVLLDSEFVLCPSGDYVWSYRFFEAIMCGAMPIVEEDCEVFAGFRFIRMSEVLGGKCWSQEDAHANFLLARERITVPVIELRDEIHRLINKA